MSSTVRLLNRLLTVHYRSFPLYLAEVGRWRAPGGIEDETDRAFRAIVHDHRTMAERAARAILAAGGAVDVGSYPMEFTDKNDLSLDYLAGEVLEAERANIGKLEQIRDALPSAAAEARELAGEAIGAAKGHVETLESLVAKQPA